MTEKEQYLEVMRYLYAQLPMYQRSGKSAFKKDLTNIIELTNRLDQPHLKFKSIHIAGTNGKGSVSHMLASILQQYGLKVGLYTSPHYKDFRERIKINGVLIPHSKVVSMVEEMKPFLDQVPASFFEMTVAMAFKYFADEQVDIAVIETGLGGRLDSTNVISPLLSVITNISMDHTDILGDTLEKIAGEKAGIIKDQVPVVVGEGNTQTSPVFKKKAANCQSPIVFAEDVCHIGDTEDKLTYSLKQNKIEIQNRNLSPYFSINCRTAIVSFEALCRTGFIKWNSSFVEEGLEKLRQNTYYIGRWEKLNDAPLTFADSAHNEAGIKMVMEKIESLSVEKLHFVLGFVKDKDINKILSMFPLKARYYWVKADVPRGLEAPKLKAKAKTLGLKGRSYASVNNGYKAAKRAANEHDLIYIGGSIFVVAEIL